MENQSSKPTNPPGDVDTSLERMERKIVRELPLIVTDEKNNQPLAGVNVKIHLFPTVEGVTGSDGRCRLEIDRFYLGKLMRLTAQKEGYREVNLDFTFKLNQEVAVEIGPAKRGFMAKLFGR